LTIEKKAHVNTFEKKVQKETVIGRRITCRRNG